MKDLKKSQKSIKSLESDNTHLTDIIKDLKSQKLKDKNVMGEITQRLEQKEDEL